MEEDVLFQLRYHLPVDTSKREKYTKQAFQIIPKCNHPHILDIGCGRGMPTSALAQLSNGTIIGLDVNEILLQKFNKRIQQEHLQDCITLVKQSMLDLQFPKESFDIIWSEGSIYVIGFQTGLQDWKPYLKPRGFLVIHEMCWIQPDPPQEIKQYWQQRYPGISTAPEKRKIINESGYTLLDTFSLPENAWWDIYYGPLQKNVTKFRNKYKNNKEILEILASEQEEINLYKTYAHWYGSAFFIMQKEA